ncbi:hypothetical protein TNCV_3434231 [Trichonephila clavipes]|nr:hypothetical protein TNCV_3434231 [Trichonephila clavipes]
MSISDEQHSGRQVSVRTGMACAVIEKLMAYIKGHGLHSGSLGPVLSCQLHVYCVVILLHREGHNALYTIVIN